MRWRPSWPTVRSRCPTACRPRSRWSDPRQKGHGDYATNVALQLAKKAGTNPRAFADLVAARLRASDGHRRRRGRGSGLPQHHRRGGCPGPGRGRRRRGRGGVRLLRRVRRARRSTSSSSPPTRPGRSTSVACAGPPSATPWAGSSRSPAPRSPGSTTSTTTARRSTASAPRCWRWAKGRPVPEDGYGGDVHRRDRHGRSSPSGPRSSTCPTTRRRRSSAPRASR